MENMVMLKSLEFYKDKKVFITGHTGFKGSWMCFILKQFGAKVMGYALEAPTNPSLFDIASISQGMQSIIGDIRDLEKLKACVIDFEPDIMIHMAAQPLVRSSYEDPVYTYETNVMGTVNFLEAVRASETVKSVLNVTTDKVYRNNEWEWGYRENDIMDGYDPYSNSKSCSELVTSSYAKSFFSTPTSPSISTARAGNVLGGGDFSIDRIIPDCVRAAETNSDIIVRNPNSIRPYQHVLEPVIMYLILAEMQYNDKKLAGNYNIGPDDIDCVTTGVLTALFCESWGNMNWINMSQSDAVHEANFLKLDCSKAKSILGYLPKWRIDTVISETVEWYKAYSSNKDINTVMKNQLERYIEG